MTCKEKYLKDHPEYSEEDFEVIFKVICPSDHGIMDDPTNEYGDSVCYRVKCINCWNREIPENDEDENKSEDESGDESGENIMTCREKLISEHPEWNDVVLMKCMQTFTPNEYFCIVGYELTWDDNYPFNHTEPENEEGDFSELEVLRDEVNTLVEKIKQLEVRIANQISTIENYREVNQELRSKLNEKESQLDSYRKTNEDLGNRLTDARIDISLKDEQIANQKSTIMDYMNIETKLNTREEEIDKLVKENETLKENIKKMGFEIDEDNNVIVIPAKLHITTVDEKDYIDTGIAVTKKIADRFNSVPNNCAIHPTDIARAIARNIRNKYEALIYVGFSHDDAMSLIPMWSD